MASTAQLPWVEKYRPSRLQDIVGNPVVLERLRALGQEHDLPHLLLAGPPGCGKTSSVHCLARLVLGTRWRSATLELNASDERGIDVVRERVKQFARLRSEGALGRPKIVFLDESDALTAGAQQALRRIMELYAGTTRFVLACNHPDKIIDAIQSRCAVFHFGALSDAEVTGALARVAAAEHADADAAGLAALVFSARGDLRQALTNLQATHAGAGTITEEAVYRVCDTPNPVRAAAVLRACRQAAFPRAYAGLCALLDEGYMAVDVLGVLFRVCEMLPEHEFGEYLRLEYIKELALALERAARGLDSRVQLTALIARLCHVATFGPTDAI